MEQNYELGGENHHKYMYECIHILELLSLKIVSWEPEGDKTV